jgi:hypothetical protein
VTAAWLSSTSVVRSTSTPSGARCPLLPDRSPLHEWIAHAMRHFGRVVQEGQHAGVKPFMAKQPVPNYVAHVSAAASGAIASAFVRVPTDTVRHRVQAFLHPNTFTAVPQLLKSKGLRGFYAGFRPTLLRDVPEIAIQFATYEFLRSVLQNRSGEQLATWQHLVLGGISGAAAACFTMPVDVLKTQLQCGGKAATQLGFVRTLQQTLSEKGASALFAGMVRFVLCRNNIPTACSAPRALGTDSRTCNLPWQLSLQARGCAHGC